MQRLLLILIAFGFSVKICSQNPHGESLKLDCAACHNPMGWEIEADHWQGIELHKPKVSKTTGLPMPIDTSLFHHNKTDFQLTGQHTDVDCRGCHETLVFSQAQSDCISCHTDMHQMTVGNDCARCHTTDHWLVDNITDLHLENGFPLIGPHGAATCNECHVSESALRFDRIGNDCINCHLDEFQASTNPDHEAAGFSTDCTECHDINKPGWETEIVDHNFFPLTKGHAINDCASCHAGGDFMNTPTDCFACHQPDFQATISPDHEVANFTTDCAQCHTTDPDWVPALYLAHDGQYFPIYSGAHEGEWSECVDCHTNPSNYAEFTCISCHANPETDNVHNGVSGYVYENTACLACHPTGSSDGSFDHNATDFPLTGAHLTTDCIECHANGYQGTPTACEACHALDFQQTTNPNHTVLALPMDCAQCHTTDPGWTPATFDIHNDFYVLNGAHAQIANDCASCHNGDYNNTPNTCMGCHTADFNQTTDPNHSTNQFPTDCETCHSETAWVPSTFDHNAIYPFTGAHVAVADDCVACHVGGNYSNTPNECAGCHTPDFNQSQNPSHTALNLPTDCAMCHTTDPDWSPAQFPIHDDFYVLNGAHAMISNDCAACHNGDYTNTPNTCFGCHNTDFNSTTNPNHVTLQFSTDCATCHGETAWVPATFDHDAQYFPIYSGAHNGEWSECLDCHTNPANYAEFTCVTCHANPETDNEHVGVNGYSYNSPACLACHPTGDATNVFDHNTTAFPLTGAHITTDCIDCHAGGYQGTPTDCAACHTTDFNQSQNPNHVALGIPTDCASCHTTDPGWSPATFAIHNDYYVLNGAHAPIANDCGACHNGNYNNTPNTCMGCHTTDFNQASDPNHQANQFPTDCETCHSETAWVPSTFDHNAVYPFTGAHVPIANECAACHVAGNYSNTPTECAGCHTPDFNQSQNPNHVALGIPTECEMCHTTQPEWMPAQFPIHDDYYVLNGAHANIANDCAACHNGSYNNTPNTCYGCHTTDYNSTTNPNHASAQFSTDCESCHSETTWVPATFDHDVQYFPIYSGAHNGEWDQCVDCHINPTNYAEVTCVTCHANPETDNQHSGVNGYSYNSPACLACHPTGDATNVFDHNNTNFPLTGAHVTADCIECHAGGYAGTPTDCAACHTTDFNQTSNPNHVALGLGMDCAQCHTTQPDWEPAGFPNHNDYYVLNGAHAPIANDCASCHNGDYNNTPNTCMGCHQTDFNQASDPNHQANQFPTDCETCHSETAWVPSTFDHNAVYPFTGAHVPIANECAACHVAGNYSNTPNECAGCHTPDFNQSQNPNHVALGIPTDCEMCHTTQPEWMPAQFPIHDDYYVLNGAHANIANDCAACHNGSYTNTPNTCYGCHTTDYNSTTNPNHASAQFSTDCESCHSETTWVPATFDHDVQYFPIYSGAHAGEWDQCVDCHINPSNYAEVSCTVCHLNPETNNAHNGVNGYSYNNSACLACHPTGSADDNFDHNNTGFPLTGAHVTADCIECHAGGYAGTPTDCAACHTTDFNQSQNPNHVALGLPTDCAACHTTDPGWSPAQFPDHNSYFVLDGAHQPIANDCALCHIGGNYNNNTPNTCAGCHTPDFNQSQNPNHVALGIPTDCALCHTTDPDWQPASFPIHDDYYVLNGAHANISNDCAACHNGNYNNTPNTCFGCHAADYNATTNPNHASAQFPTTCDDCHTETAWVPANFDHSQFYPLTGAHQPIANDCALCHIGGNYNNTPNTCAGCHTPDFNQSQNPNHQALGLPTDCEMCHTTSPDWEPATFPIHNDFYVLNGAHANIANDCATCHNGNYNNTPNTCFGCHATDYNATTNPDHAAAQFPTTCEDCHSETAWSPSTFDHSQFYPFNGAHVAIANDCNACHNGNYNNTPNTCAGCHTDDYNQTADPDHQTNQFPTTCEDCHTETAWTPSTFDHNQFYPLVGAHATIANDCYDCHAGNYNNTPNTCYGCHQPDYNQSTDPNHQTNQLPTDCEDCHTQTAWEPSTFDHTQFYPFTGAHVPIANDCALCHVGGNYTNTPNTCAGCHTPDYNSTTNPNHVALGISNDCEMCHTTSPDWEPAQYPNHSSVWPFTGAHASIQNDCAACHNGNYNNTPNTCAGCHLTDYNQTTNPNHAQNQFPTTCEDCHSQNGWVPATFDHNTIYPFTGAHIAIANDCAACHNGNYTNTPNTCAGCHTPDYNSSTNPNHSALGLPMDCEMCHTTDPDWNPAQFPNHNTYWPLNGAHAAIQNDCAACHNGNYNNTPNTCFGCHATDYNQANNPNHASAGFPTTCDDCHSVNAWVPATFDHDNMYFPIYSGRHEDEWDDCTDCHINSGNYSIFSCIDCHEHDDPAELEDDHEDVPGYTYSSPACYSCHPEGED